MITVVYSAPKKAMDLGIHPRTLYYVRDKSLVERISRGVFRLASLPPLSQPDLATVALRIPRAVICLVSALSYHDITTQIPHEAQIADAGARSQVLTSLSSRKDRRLAVAHPAARRPILSIPLT